VGGRGRLIWVRDERRGGCCVRGGGGDWVVSRMQRRRRVVARLVVSVAVLAGVPVAAGWTAAGQPESGAVGVLAARSHGGVRQLAGSGGSGSAPGSSLNAVAAISRTSAWAVGTIHGFSPANVTLIDRWNGTRWTVVPSPSPGGAGGDAVSVLTGVAALSRTDTWAVGYWDSDAAVLSTRHALILHWDGAKWRRVPSPRLADSVLNGITALSPADVWAVGFTGRHTLIEHWNGVRWTRVPSPSLFDSALNAVAATSRASAWAVGHAGRGTLTERWNGIRWTRVPSPSPDRRRGTALLAVTAISRTDAWAGGRYQNPAESGLIEHWNGATWRQVRSAGNIVRGVAATSGGVGWAVGSAGRLALIEHRAGQRWATVRGPVPAGAAAVQLRAVTLVSARSGWAAGDYLDGSQLQALIERWNGNRWQQVPAPGPVGPRWGTAIPVPGFAALNTGGTARINSLSCASAGNCSAGGQYLVGPRGLSADTFRAFVVSQVNGHWGTAVEVPGTDVLNAGGNALINSVSCASAGNCAAGGYYAGSDGIGGQAFVVSQVNGHWGTATEVPGTAALNADGAAQVNSVSCASAGNCSAVGTYHVSGHQQVFAASEVNGTWGTAIQVPGTAALEAGGEASISSVSCSSAGNCSAGGDYSDGSTGGHAFVVSQVNGHWGTAIQVPGTAALSAGRGAVIYSVSCASAGNCSAGGAYTVGHFGDSAFVQAFVVSQVSGHWGTAIEVPGTKSLNSGREAAVYSVSCASPGNCSAGGTYSDGGNVMDPLFQGFVVSQVNGHWGTAIEVPGTAALNVGRQAAVISVSCGSAGNCSAGGAYSGGANNSQAFVVSQVNGTWGTAIEVPGTDALNTHEQAGIESVSCASPRNCSAGGSYIGVSDQEVFVVSAG
jgi:hypothetical protein